MDSGNSGSISSSGDEEYDSHADPWYLNHATTHFGSISQSQAQPSVVASMFDVSSNYQQNPNPVQCEGPRSEPNCNSQTAVTRNGKQSLSLSGPNKNNAVRNSKKRSRASRRAPTTVLTTDTSNFRSMVQEFTGIPAPPFSASSSFYTRRLPVVSTHSRSLIHNNMNIPSATATATATGTSNNNSLNYHLPPDPHNMMPFHSSSSLHPIIPTAPFGAKSSFHDDVDVDVDVNNCRDPFSSLDPNYHNPSPAGQQPTIHSWISSSHQ